MNRHATPSPKPLRRFGTFALAAAALTLSACQSEPPGPSQYGVDLRGSSLGGEFTMTSHEGKPVSFSDFDGQYRLVYLGFTYCPDICPTDVQRLSQGLQAFEKTNPDGGSRVQPIFISVDPARDSVDVLSQFVSNFHPRLIGLRADEETTKQVLTQFGAAAPKDEPDASGNYNIAHTTLTYLFSPEGEPLGVIPTDKGAEGVTAELARWVR
jgi:protein SCO1/2